MTSAALSRLGTVVDDGLQRASQGLTEMAGNPIEVVAARLVQLPIEVAVDLVGGPELIMAGVYMGIKGDVEGHMLLMLPHEDACRLAAMLLNQPLDRTRQLCELARSALAEAANLVGSFFLAALADATALRLLPTPPVVVLDMSGAILDTLLADLGMESREVLAIDAVFMQSMKQVSASFLVLPKQHCLDKILRSLPK